MKHKDLTTLFKTFFKIGLFTFGGGYSMLPLIEKEICEKHKFINQNELMDMISISECTPGPISINCSTFIGYKIFKLKGAIVSTLGLVLPSFFIILLISLFFDYFKSFNIINKFLHGIKIGVLPLLISSIWKLDSKSKKTKYHYTIIFTIVIISLVTNISTITILLTSITIFIAAFFIKTRRYIKK